MYNGIWITHLPSVFVLFGLYGPFPQEWPVGRGGRNGVDGEDAAAAASDFDGGGRVQGEARAELL